MIERSEPTTTIDYGPRFNRELALNWVDALESGDYQQGQRFLHPTPDTFCCLGVMCDLANPEGWITPANPEDPIPYTDHITVLPEADTAHQVGLIGGSRYDEQPWELPAPIAAKLHRAKTYTDDIALDGFNDNLDLSFMEIASILRLYYGLPPREETSASTPTS